MAYAYVNNKLASVASGAAVSSLQSGASNDTSGNLLVACVLQIIGGAQPTITDLAGNSFTPIGSTINTSAAFRLWYLYAKNIATFTNNKVTAACSSASVNAVAAFQYSGLDTTAPLSGFSGAAQASPGTGANTLSSGSFSTSATSGMLFGFCVNCVHVARDLPSAGTSPIAFTGEGAIWGNWGTNSAQCEDAAIASAGNYAATYGTDANNGGDNFITFGAVFALAGAPPPSTGMNGGQMLLGVGQ